MLKYLTTGINDLMSCMTCFSLADRISKGSSIWLLHTLLRCTTATFNPLSYSFPIRITAINGSWCHLVCPTDVTQSRNKTGSVQSLQSEETLWLCFLCTSKQDEFRVWFMHLTIVTFVNVAYFVLRCLYNTAR